MPKASGILVRGGLGDRWAEPLKLLPVGFVLANILGLYAIYMTFHAMPRYRRHTGVLPGSWLELASFNLVTGLMLVCYIRCIVVAPGTVSDEDPSWVYPLDSEAAALAEAAAPGNLAAETKRSGERRHCKWCGKYKPDRCHHCRVCRTCILKMDHHCPWIYNCVGFGNHKYFFLLFFYAVLNCHLVFWTMLPTLRSATHHETPFLTMFLVLFGETFAAFLGMLTTPFFIFHVWLMFKAMTIIEFCEKALKRTGYDSSVYDHGMLGNVQTVLGENPLFWLLPMCPPEGDGLSFQAKDLRLSKDVEAGRGLRRRTHNANGAAHKRPRHCVKAAGTGAPPTPGQSDDSAAEDLEEEEAMMSAGEGSLLLEDEAATAAKPAMAQALEGKPRKPLKP